MPPLEAVLLGAGQRGRDAAGAFAVRHPDALKFVAVAEPDDARRERFAREHGIPPRRRYRSYEDLLVEPQLAPLCFNLTMDRMHWPSSVPALERGYHLYLEKPMAESPEGCAAIVAAARRTGRLVQICHPLRFTPFYRKIKDLLDAGAVGRVLAITMVENVGYWHFGHSFVRGNWAREAESGPVILTKCCHDMDLAAWLAGSAPRRVASLGALRFFRPENAPPDAPARCTDGCPAEAECPFYAPRQYLTDSTDWPVNALSLDTDPEARRRALDATNYGLCVFRAGNDVVDHQVVDVEFADGALLHFSVFAASVEPYRTVRINGTRGEINGHLEKGEIAVSRFEQGFWPAIGREIHTPPPLEGAHSGGDTGAILNFLRCVRENDVASIGRSLDIALEGHLLTFAAERARATGAMLDFAAFRNTIAPPAAEA